jgi:hypothetical protein
VWSKAGRFVEGLNAIGDIITKISVKYVINLHVALLFTCLFLWVYPVWFTTVFIFMGIVFICCMYTFTVISV